MNDLPDNYDPWDDIDAVDRELTGSFTFEHPLILSFQRLQFYILELQQAAREARDDEPARAGHPDIDSAGGDGGLDRAYGEKRG